MGQQQSEGGLLPTFRFLHLVAPPFSKAASQLTRNRKRERGGPHGTFKGPAGYGALHLYPRSIGQSSVT